MGCSGILGNGTHTRKPGRQRRKGRWEDSCVGSQETVGEVVKKGLEVTILSPCSSLEPPRWTWKA